MSDEGGCLSPDAASTGDVAPGATRPEAAGWPPPGPSEQAAVAPLAASPDQPEEPALEESLLTVWLHPRATIRRIVAVDATYGVVPLAAIGGITQVLASASRRDLPDASLAGILLGAFIGGPLFGVLALYVGAWLTWLTGRWWLHGVATAQELRAAYGWASVAHVLALPLWLLATAAFGLALFTESGGELTARSPVYLLFAVAVVGLQVWGPVLAAAGVAEVQGYRSAWKGLWNIVLGLLLVIAAAVALALVAGLLVALTGLPAR